MPEGDDKPLKYPAIFESADAVVLNKWDTLPVFDFDREAFDSAVRALNPGAPIIPIAATKGDGVDEWAEWLAERARSVMRAGMQAGASPVCISSKTSLG